MSSAVIAALGLVLVIEGLLPLLTPATWRNAFKRITELSDGQIRFMGLVSLLGGGLLVLLAA